MNILAPTEISECFTGGPTAVARTIECQELHDEKARLGAEIETLELAAIDESGDPSDAAFVKACRDELAKRKPEPAAETVGGLAKAVKAARGGDAPPAPMRRFA